MGLNRNTFRGAVKATSHDLHYAIERRCVENVRSALDACADPRTTVNGATALSLALYKEANDIVKILLSLKIDGETKKGWAVNVDQLSRDRLHRVEPPLVTACRLGNKEAVMLLLDRGADMEQVNNEQRTALWMAVHQRELAIAELLIDRGACVNPSTVWFRAPIFAAFRTAERSAEIILLLLLNGANVNIERSHRSSLAQLASNANYSTARRLIRLLLDAGYDFTYESRHGETLQDVVRTHLDSCCPDFPSLRHLCIIAVRSTLMSACCGRQFSLAIQRLPLPSAVRNEVALHCVTNYWTVD